ncbi:ww domain-containing protein [Diplodia corticola]|uniref:Ww domain-containing protein n=1 Tax=Diplodia corticola TaxID=236234 RepID=A0A1J9RYL3_9PEZI|nr:ww domain-containing protein [Diplodia corticola]OJD33439.1 ww domain-containing protein [Diplodia corticola]
MSDDTARSPAPAQSLQHADEPAPSDRASGQASDDRSPRETAKVSASGSTTPGESTAVDDKSAEADTPPDVRSPKDDDDDAAEATPAAKKRKRSPDPESSDHPESADPAATASDAPPLPTDEVPPPLPDEEPPAQQDDGWEALWDQTVAAYYFYNRHTGVTQWENPRVPEASSSAAPAVPALPAMPAVPAAPGTTGYGSSSLGSPPRKRGGGYNPAIHGDFDPNADYAQDYLEEEAEAVVDPEAAAALHAAALGGDAYAQTGSFNRFTGRFQAGDVGPEQHNDENKSKRQLNAYFDVDAAANSHDGRSLRAERQNKRLSKKELQAFKAKAAKKKEEKRRAWLRD